LVYDFPPRRAVFRFFLRGLAGHGIGLLLVGGAFVRIRGFRTELFSIRT
jgi:hypothetical protein